jgi:hypothetical protein
VALYFTLVQSLHSLLYYKVPGNDLTSNGFSKSDSSPNTNSLVNFLKILDYCSIKSDIVVLDNGRIIKIIHSISVNFKLFTDKITQLAWWQPKMSKMKLGKTVENGKLLFTPNCRKQKSILVQNVENLFKVIFCCVKLNLT